MGLPQHRYTLDEYLAWENQQPERHEFHRGEVFAMVGGRRSHGRVVLNVAARLMQRLAGTPCQVFAESMKVQVAADTVLYPDVFVTCDKADLATEMIFRAPTLVVEVLSPSTNAYDRSLKFALYRQLAALREYVLIDPDERRVEAFRLDAAGQWIFDDMSQGAELRLDSLGAAVSLAEVFEGVEPPP